MSHDEKQDVYSGIPWVYVTPEQARSHPKGKLTTILWIIGGYLVLIGLIKLYVFWASGFALGVVLIGGLLPLLAGAGLLLRMPWAVVATLVMAGFNLYAFVRNVGPDSTALFLLDALISVGIIFYLAEGDRPNLIYRHRYRKYSVLREGKDDA